MGLIPSLTWANAKRSQHCLLFPYDRPRIKPGLCGTGCRHITYMRKLLFSFSIFPCMNILGLRYYGDLQCIHKIFETLSISLLRIACFARVCCCGNSLCFHKKEGLHKLFLPSLLDVFRLWKEPINSLLYARASVRTSVCPSVCSGPTALTVQYFFF